MRTALLLVALVACNFLFGEASPLKVPRVMLSSMARGHPERALTEMRRDCENHADCSAGLDLYAAARRICVYRCMSDECYQEVYGMDELEEGEVDSERYRKFGECFRQRMKDWKD